MVARDPDIQASYVVWEHESVSTTADQALAEQGGAGGGKTATDDAIEFLRAVLKDGPRLVLDIEHEAGAACHLGLVERINKSKAFRLASETLEVKKDREGFGPGAKYWWSLRADDRERTIQSRSGGVWSGQGAGVRWTAF